MILAFYTISNCLRGNRTTASPPARYSNPYAGEGNNANSSADRRSGSIGQQRSGIVGAIGGRGSGNGSGSRNSGQKSNVDEENRLIDQLDEEWDD